ncbi:MAG TPA: FUSC family protein [Amycolatopsis sp.]|nr:FUSC family protein [Amycolatopsis sp.]
MTRGPAAEVRPVERLPPAAGDARQSWLPVWSKASAMRAVRATVVVPGLFALGQRVIGDPQLATFAAFGGFATLVMASFGGQWQHKLRAHLGLALAGSVLLVIGTAVSSSVLLASLITVPVAFVVLFGGVAGPNAAAGGTAALLAYVLPAASPGTADMIPARLAGWWLASVVGTLAVLAFSPRPPGFALREAAARCARAVADQIVASLAGDTGRDYPAASIDAKHELLNAFTSTPYRPTGLTTADQAMDKLVGLLEWCVFSITDSLRDPLDPGAVADEDRRLLAETAVVLRDLGTVLDGAAVEVDLVPLERRLAESVAHLRHLDSDGDGYAEVVRASFHARTVAVVAHTAMDDALVAAGRATSSNGYRARRPWYGAAFESEALGEHRRAGLVAAAGVVARHASLRSVWFLNSIRGALAIAAAVAVAGLTDVQHGFWVVLGTLSVLRTSAASTGATALRALFGTAIGFVVGALLLLAVGTGPTALWIALPVAVVVAGYAPGALPFWAGQAAFTVVVSVLFNLLAPAGWKIGVLRVEDVALGCAVSVVVGVLFWPRGASSVVADDLADALRAGGTYLAEAVDWALGLRAVAPQPHVADAAGVRLDDGLRGFLAEQGSKRVAKQDLWLLVAGATRVRLTAFSLVGLPSPEAGAGGFRTQLSEQAGRLDAWCDHLASRLDRTDHGAARVLEPPEYRDPRLAGATAADLACALWVGEHLRHLMERLRELVEPATAVADLRHRPWWR